MDFRQIRFRRSRSKDKPKVEAEDKSWARKSFNKLMGVKSAALTPQPLAASGLHQGAASLPHDWIVDGTSASPHGSTAANESITTTPPCRQPRVPGPADDASITSKPDAQSGDSNGPMVSTVELSEPHGDGTDASSLEEDTGDDSINAVQFNDTSLKDALNTPKSLWDRAYDALRSSDDPEKSRLIADYERQLLQQVNKISERGELNDGPANSILDQGPTSKEVLDRAIKDALEHARERSYTRSLMGKAGNLASTVQNFVGEALKASPEASLVWAGVCLFLPLLTRPMAADEAHRNAFPYVTSRISYWTTLERDLSQAITVPDSIQEGFVTLYQHLLEFQVRTVLRYHQSGFERFTQDLSFNVWEQLVTVIKEQDDRLKKDLQQHQNSQFASFMKTMSEKDTSAKSLDEALSQIQNILSQEKECLRLFRITDNKADVSYEWYKDRVKERIEGTCVWAVGHEEFKKWLKLKAGPLLITADPGCGKSVLSKYLIDQCLPERCPTATICYFFFKDKDQNTVKQAVCALLHQLFCQKPDLIDHALEEYERNGKGMIGTTSSLQRVFHDATHDERAGPIIIVLDALDECDAKEFTILVENFIKFGEGGAKFLLTSRPYSDVVIPFEQRSMLEEFPHVRIPGEQDENSDEISAEIDIVLKARVDEFATKHTLNDELKQTIWEGLRGIPHRTYLWVYLLFEDLEAGMRKLKLKVSPQGFKTAMKKLPTDIYGAYERMLDRCEQEERVALRRALSVLLVAQRPFQVDEFKVVVNMEPHITSPDEVDLSEDDYHFEKRLRAMCGLFLSIHQKKVCFLHQTAREFLLAKSEISLPLQHVWRHTISESLAHAELACVCVWYIYVLGPRISELNQEHSFLTYSAAHWRYHFRKGEFRNDAGFLTITTAICQPASKPFLSWTLHCSDEPEATVRTFSSGLHVAVALSCHQLVQHMLQDTSAGNINTCHSFWETSPLALAARHGDYDGVQLLIKEGALPNVGWEDRSPLYEAVNAESLESVLFLLDNGASVNHLDARGRTLLHLTAGPNQDKVKYCDFAHIILSVRSDHCRNTDGIELAKLMIERGVQLDAADKSGTTALMLAVFWRRWDLATFLLEAGADPNPQNHKGESVLHMFSCSDDDQDKAESLLRLLVGKCTKLEARDHEGRTPLQVALSRKLANVASLLLEVGADVEVTDNEGKTPLLVAVGEENLSITEMLLASGANIEVTDNEGNTPLFTAVAEPYPSMVEKLLQHGAQLTKSGVNSSPLQKAQEMVKADLRMEVIFLGQCFQTSGPGTTDRREVRLMVRADTFFIQFPEFQELKKMRKEDWSHVRAEKSRQTYQILRRHQKEHAVPTVANSNLRSELGLETDEILLMNEIVERLGDIKDVDLEEALHLMIGYMHTAVRVVEGVELRFLYGDLDRRWGSGGQQHLWEFVTLLNQNSGVINFVRLLVAVLGGCLPWRKVGQHTSKHIFEVQPTVFDWIESGRLSFSRLIRL